MASSDTEQFARFKDPNQWGAPAGNLMQHRYSALKDINTDNVKDLQFAWAQSSGALRGHEGQPLVISDVGGKPMMFIIAAGPRCRSATSCRRSIFRSGSSDAGVELHQDQRPR